LKLHLHSQNKCWKFPPCSAMQACTLLLILLVTLCTDSVNTQCTVHTVGYFVVAHETMVGCFLYTFWFKQPQEKKLGLNIVFNNTSRPLSVQRHVCRPAVLKQLLDHVTCAFPHTASAIIPTYSSTNSSLSHSFPASTMYQTSGWAPLPIILNKINSIAPWSCGVFSDTYVMG
jgi:hypothetical protein